MRGAVKRLLRVVIFPVVRYFGPRFQNVHARLDQVNHRLSSLETFEGSRQRTSEDLESRLSDLDRQLKDFQQRVSVDFDTILEVLIMQQRSSATIERQIDELTGLLTEAQPVDSLSDRQNHAAPGQSPRERAADLLQAKRSEGRPDQAERTSHAETSLRTTNL